MTLDVAHWLIERRGKLTASRMTDAMAFHKRGPTRPTEARQRYMRELLAERLTGITTEHYVSAEMQWGLDNEEGAWMAYEAATGMMVQEPLLPFYDHPRIPMCGASPDREIGTDGLLESKCPTTQVHLGYLLAGEAPDDYIPQMTLQLACTGRHWCDFVSFDPRIQDRRLRLFIHRFQPRVELIEAMEGLAMAFLRELDELALRVNNGTTCGASPTQVT